DGVGPIDERKKLCWGSTATELLFWSAGLVIAKAGGAQCGRFSCPARRRRQADVGDKRLITERSHQRLC
ncbi:MAG: hypothetical protein ACK4QW_03320, partial [Alphaproteobacteria bacterium]